MEIRTTVDENFMKSLSAVTGKSSASEITRDALALYQWATKQVKEGRQILSATSDGSDIERVTMPSLAEISASPKASFK